VIAGLGRGMRSVESLLCLNQSARNRENRK